MAPIEQSRAQQELNAVFDALLADNRQAWELRPDGSWRRLHPKRDDRAREAQSALMRRAQLRSRRQAEYRSRAR